MDGRKKDGQNIKVAECNMTSQLSNVGGIIEMKLRENSSLCHWKLYTHSFTLKAPITTAADDKFIDIFPNYRKK